MSRVVAVVAARDEEEHLGATLDSILAQTHPPEHIVVINDGSVDDTPLIAESRGCIVVHTPPHEGNYVGTKHLAAVWNVGLAEADRLSPDYVFISGADHVYPADYVERLLNHMDGTRIVVASGVIKGQPSNKDSPRGSGRLINAHYWRHVSGMRYHDSYGWESYLVVRAHSLGLGVYVDYSLVGVSRALTFNSRKALGLGRAMRVLGYWFPYAFLRSVKLSLRKPRLGLFMLAGYLLPGGPRLDCADHLGAFQRVSLRERLDPARIRRGELLRSPDDRGILPFIRRSRRRTRRVTPERRLGIFLTTRCNMNCFSCVALGMTPRPLPEDTTLAEIEAFLTHMEKSRPGTHVTLTGGEPTMYEDLGAVCDAIRRHGFKTFMLTNGYNMPPMEWFDYILLDHHGINDAALDKWKPLMDEAGVKWGAHRRRYHMDTAYAMEDNITKGARCSKWLSQITLWRNVVYPCCNIMCVEWWHHTDAVTQALLRSGWHIGNPDLPDIIENWRETLPPEVYQLCTVGCWKDSENIRWSRI